MYENYKELERLLDRNFDAVYSIKEEVPCFSSEEELERADDAEKVNPQGQTLSDVPILVVKEYTSKGEESKKKTGAAISLAHVLSPAFTLSNKCWLPARSVGRIDNNGPSFIPEYKFFKCDGKKYFPYSVMTSSYHSMEGIIKFLMLLRRHQLCS